MYTILLVEDEEPIRNMIRFALSRAGMDMLEAVDVGQARQILEHQLPDLILLDWMLPDESGLILLKQLRKHEIRSQIPVIMLTARAEEENRVRGLESGADDYVTKPFSPKELIARINAVIRRSAGRDDGGGLTAGPLSLNPGARQVLCAEQRVDLGPTEFRLLEFFMSHPGRVYSRAQLLDYVWPRDNDVEERTVDVSIRRLRKALVSCRGDEMIQTARGAGYCFEPGD